MRNLAVSLGFWCCLCLLFPLPEGLAQDPIVEQELQWLELVEYIMSPVELEVFQRLTHRERKAFVKAFWKARDPIPSTEINEFEIEHRRRVKYADDKLGWETPRRGSKSERGWAYIALGPPHAVYEYPGKMQLYPTEVWYYTGQASRGLPSDFYLLFCRFNGIGEFKLYDPQADGPSRLVPQAVNRFMKPGQVMRVLRSIDMAVARASLAVDLSSPHDYYNGIPWSRASEQLAIIRGTPLRTAPDGYARRWDELQGEVRTEASFDLFSMPVTMALFRGPDGDRFLYYALEVPPERIVVEEAKRRFYLALEAYLSLVDSEAEEVGTLEEKAEGRIGADDLEVLGQSALQLWGVAAASREVRGARSVVRQSLTRAVGRASSLLQPIPDPSTDKIALSEPILGYLRQDAVSGKKGHKVPEATSRKSLHLRGHGIAPKEGEPGCAEPLLGPGTLWPAPGKIDLGDGIGLYLQLYGPPGTELPDGGQIRLSLRPEDGESSGSPVWSAVLPILGGFCPGGLIEVVADLPLGEVQAGKYLFRADFSASGKESLAVSKRSVDLAVPGPNRRWAIGFQKKPLDHYSYRLIRARQLRQSGHEARAVTELEKVLAAVPDHKGALRELAMLLLQLKRPKEVARWMGDRAAGALLTTGSLPADDVGLLALAAAAQVMLGDFSRAEQIYARAVSAGPAPPRLLNALAATQQAQGKLDLAAKHYRLSLERDSKQPRIQRLLEKIRKGRSKGP